LMNYAYRVVKNHAKTHNLSDVHRSADRSTLSKTERLPK
jgi:hypothetical protein